MNQPPKTVLKTRSKKWFLLFILSFIFLQGKMSAQGCECVGCQGPIPISSTNTYTLNVSGATNPNLSNPGQGVCGIYLDVTFEHIWSLTITLTSPSGQMVTLMGPYDNFPSTTGFSNWDISFLPCGDPVSPDPMTSGGFFNDQWTNLQQWAFFTNYTGSYYPYLGCLEDFNSGSVDGDWTITVTNGSSVYDDGSFNGFSILFCDDSGMGCTACDANAGDLSVVDDIDLCIGENYNGSIDPFYSFGTEPNNQYDYTYIISQSSIIQSYEMTPDLSTYSEGTYEICGLSYLSTDVSLIPPPNGILSVADLEVIMTSTAPFCGDISDDCFVVTVYPIPDTIFISDTFCRNENYVFAGNVYSAGGVYYPVLPASAGCDTIVELSLGELQAYEENISSTICQGDTFFVANIFHVNTGNYADTLTSVLGCDSIINLDLTVLNPQAIIVVPDTIICSSLEIELNASGSTGDSYIWSTNDGNIMGNTLNNITTVDRAGRYYFMVTQVNSGVVCTAIDSVDVIENLVAPIVSVPMDSIITCDVPTIVLDGNGSSVGSEFSYEWTTINGNITQDTFTLLPTINSGGTYVLSVTNNDNDCVSQDSVLILQNTNFPSASAGAAMEINCDNPTVQLDGSSSSQGNAFIYLWTTTDGNILLGNESLQPTVDSAGTYLLTVTDTFSNCATIDFVDVTIDTLPPIADAGNDFTVNCFTPLIQVDATNSSQGGQFSYQWNALTGGPVMSGATTLMPTINVGGTYELVVTNDLTGCSSSSQMTVNQDFINPIIVVESPIDTISCLENTIIIDASNSSVGANFEYEWTVIGSGNILADTFTLLPQIDLEGMYQLEIMNIQNGCTSIETVEVFSNNTFPTAEAGGNLTINCNQFEVMLDGSGSIGTEYEYLWTATNGGNILSGGTTFTPTVNGDGDYELLVTNTLSGCTQTDLMSVTVDTIPPVAVAGIDTLIDCYNNIITLDGGGSSSGDFSYLWSTSDGTIDMGGMTLQPTISGGGTFELLVTNNQNGCSLIDSVFVGENLLTPISIAGLDTIITCTNSTIFLNGNGSSVGVEFEYLWTPTNGGNILSNPNSLQPEITSAGNYELLVTNIVNGCTTIDEVIVLADTDIPTAEAGSNLTIDCNQLEVMLDGSGSLGIEYEYLWTATNGGNILNGGTTFTPTVNGEGDYELLVTNTLSGCTQTDFVSVMVDTIPPVASAGIDTLIDCYNNVITLNGGGSSSGDFSYLWSSSDGTIDMGTTTLQPTISGGGTFELLVTNNQNGCSSIDSVFVGENLIPPTSIAGLDTVITCANPTIFLNGNGSSVGVNFEYQWTTSNGGNIISNPTSLQPEVDSAGNYQLLVTNIINGCTTIDEVIVLADTDIPTLEAGSNMTIDCNQLEVILDGSGSVGTEYEYLWTATNGGNILSGETTFVPTVNGDGDYELLVTNISNGCTGTDFVSVTVDTIPPIASAGIDTLIDCYNNVITLNGGGSSSGDFSYLWSSSDGTIDMGATTLQSTISGGGTFELLVTNNQNGCSSIDSVFVGENLITPISIAGLDTVITCANPTIFLNGNGSSVGINFEYQWTATNGGNISSSPNSLQAEITSAGNYELLVTNMINGCTSIDEVIVIGDTNLPTANAGLTDTINCNQSVINLDGTASSTGINLIYSWTTSDGNIVFGENTLTPQVDSAGNYFLIVTDTISGCMAQSSVEIFLDTLPPNADAGSTMELSCLIQNVILEGTNSSAGSDFSYQWTTNDGSIFSNQNSLQPTVIQSGTYYLEVTNNINTCAAVDSVLVTQNITPPIAIAGVDTLITCDNLTLILDGAGSSIGINYLYQWTATNGGIIDDNSTSLQPEISNSGNYELVVTDSTNGCTASDFLIVDIDTNSPTADAGLPYVINCTQPILTLDGSLSSVGSIYDYGWTTVGGNIIAGDTTLFPQIDSAGIYILEVTNTQNGCSNISTVTITTDTIIPIAAAGIDTMITCESNVINLNGTNSSIGDFTYNWTTTGTGIIVNENTLTPEINNAGTYQLEVTNTQNGCISIDEVEVVFDTITPIADAGLDGVLDCDTTSLTLGGNSSVGANFEYQWTYSAGGNILTDSTQAMITVNAGATYTLLVTNILNSCTATDEAVILADANLPIAITNLMDTILCDSSQLTLNGNGSSVGVDFIYNWTTSDGNIIANENTLSPIVDSAGLYTLTVTNTSNNCAATAFVNVVLEDCGPIAFAGADGKIDCNFPTTILDGSGSSVGTGITYFWTTSDGVILSDTTTLMPTVGASGTYVLTVENTLYGFVATDTVLVDNLINFPIVDLSVNTLLSCTDTTVLVDGSNSSMGAGFLYSWSTNDGNIVAVIGDDSISVNQTGFYFLEITNNINGCVTIDSIEVFQDNDLPFADAGMDAELNCYNNEFTLDGSGSSVGNNFIYHWTTSDGNILSGDSTLNPLIDSIGTYVLEVTDTTNGCFAQSSVLVTGDFVVPIVDAGISDVLTCIDSILTLDGTASSQGGNFTYEWTTDDGNILNGGNTLTPQVDSSGNYQLVVFDNLNGCVDSSFVFINSNFIAPTANAGMDEMIDCGVGSLFLNGSGSSMGTQFLYSWTTSNGNILADTNTLSPEITTGGNYFLTVENTANGCTAIDEVMINSINCAPMVMIDLPDTLTCVVTQITLDGSASSNWGTIKYEWTTGNGNIVGVNNLPMVEVSLPGTYQLTLTDTLTNEIAFASVMVEINNVDPIADAGITDTLNCLITSLNLDGSVSSMGSSFSYLWTTGNGNIVSGFDEINPLINEDGTYNLEVTNIENGCTATSSVLIEIDTILPTVDVGFPVEFTCVDTMLFLNGLGSSMGNDFVYEWTTGDGNIVGDFTILSPQINEPGTYELTILNTLNFCEASDQILITIDTIAPTIFIEPASVLNCDLTEFDLDATTSSTGNNFTTQWQTSNGNIVNGINSLSPEINDGGDYELFILNTQNGCSSTETITVLQDTIVPVSEAGITMGLTCVDTLLTLDGSGSSSGNNFSYQWQTSNGNIENGANSLFPNINLIGDYELIVINNNNMCTSIDTVQVFQDITAPIAIVDIADTLNCVIENTILSAGNSSNGLIYSYLWNTDNGNINNGATSLNPQVSEGGVYNLVVTNDGNGCTATDFIEVMQDTIVPISEAGVTMTLTCVDTVLTLSGNGSSVGNEFNYEWTTDVGNFVNGTNSLNPQVDELGIYQLEITNSNNMCTSSDFVEILENIAPPEIEINAIGGLVLNCNISSIVLDGSSSLPNGNVSFEWSSTNGNILMGSTDPNPEVDLEGDYLLVLTNGINGCTATEMVQITGDFELPIVQILEPDTLTCLDTLVAISGSGSSVGNEFEYLWTHTIGNIVSGETTLECTVDEFGDYTLTVLNTNNGCMSSEVVTVYQNADAPFADAGGNYEFDCIQTVKMLQGDASQGAEFTYLWTTDDGNITVGSTSLQPIVDAFGTYVLTVTNQINGCTAISEAIVTQDLDVPQNVELEIISPLCYGDYNGSLEVLEVIGGEAPYLYSIDGNNFTEYPLFSNLPAGNYLITIKDASGCEWNSMFEIVAPVDVMVDLGEDIFLELGESTVLQAMTNISTFDLDSVSWMNIDSLACEDCLEQEVAPLFTTGYGVFLMNENGCVTEDEVIVYVNNKRRIFIPNAFSPNGDGQNDVFMIYGGLGVEEIEDFQIYSRWGDLVFEKNSFQPNDPTMGWDGFFNGEKMNPAVFVFFAKIRYANGETEIVKGDLFLK